MFLSGYVACGRAESTECLCGFDDTLFLLLLFMLLWRFFILLHILFLCSPKKSLFYVLFTVSYRVILKKQDGLSFLYSGLLHRQRLNWINKWSDILFLGIALT